MVIFVMFFTDVPDFSFLLHIVVSHVHLTLFSIYTFFAVFKDSFILCLGFKSHLPHTEKRAESFDFIQVFCFFYCLNDTIFVSRRLTFLGGGITISCGGCRADKTSWSFCSVLIRVKM